LLKDPSHLFNSSLEGYVRRARLDDDIFTSGLLAGNSVAGSQFVIGTAALDAGDCIIYNSGIGAVYYDSDGTGAAPQIQFARLSPGLALANFDFLVVA
jgi:serralysin